MYKVTKRVCCVCSRPFVCNIYSNRSLNTGRQPSTCYNASFKTYCECQYCYAKRLLGRYKLTFIKVNDKYFNPCFNFGNNKDFPELPYEFSCWLITKKQVEEWALEVL
jgi:hypothetical protein